MYFCYANLIKTMGQSLSKLYIHLVFSTLDNKQFINEQVCKDLKAFFKASFKANKCDVDEIICFPDHLHILFNAPASVNLSMVFEDVKKSTSKFMKQIEYGNSQFAWQKGYLCHSVSYSELSSIIEIMKQKPEGYEAEDFVKELRELSEFSNINNFREKLYK